MRNKVLEFLKDGSGLPEERYNKAMELYRKSQGHSVPAVNYYNRAGFTGHNLKNICYDLKKLHGIKDGEIANFGTDVKKIVVVGAGSIAGTIEEVLKLMPDEVKAIVVFMANMPKGDYPAETTEIFNPLREFVEEHKSVFVDADGGNYTGDDILKILYESTEGWEDKDKLVDALAEKLTNMVISKSGPGSAGSFKQDLDLAPPAKTPLQVLIDAPEDAKAGLKLIEEFPFLDDADCPDKLKILVQDKFTAWRNYQKAHAALLVVTQEGKDPVEMTEAQLFEMAKGAIENFQLNHAIYDELTYYKEHKNILGNHPIFADEVLKEKVAKLKDAAALKRRNNLRTYISRDTPKIAKAASEAAGRKLQEKVQGWTQELNLLNERLGEGK
tara:strand:+ start:22952 stop:24106 length:1155 start_codon:yes stop_codon:yes gene_type:complete